LCRSFETRHIENLWSAIWRPVSVKWSDVEAAVKEFLDRILGAPAPQPVPVRVNDKRRRPRR
ncbi:MAG: hypothetical protein AAF322_08480, partial [Pseudomonadota bacterium]